MKRLLFISMIALLALAGRAEAAGEVLQPGDVLAVQFSGEEAFEAPFQIDQEGRVILPEVGSVRVVGLSITDAGEVIRASLSSVYRGLSRLSVTVKERRLLITVLGYVKKPGPVNVPAGATVQMAINEAGGLAQGAQLDRLLVRRGSKKISFNYKKYLDSGDPSLLPDLRSLDVVFVPASPLTGNVHVEFDAQTLTAVGDAGEDSSAVKVFGEVHRPGLFSYKEGAGIVDMLMRAGGVTRYAGVEQIRIISNGQPRPFNLREYLDTGDKALMPKLGKGDIVFVPQASDQVKMGSRTVYVMGEVFRPGALETKEGATFFDILANAGGPTRFAETRQIRILRADGTVEPFDLTAYTNGQITTTPEIYPGDAILVPEKTDTNETSWLKVPPGRAIRIIGAVKRPGRYEWSDEMSLLDLIAHAGGPRADADTAHVQVLTSGEEGRFGAREFDLKGFLEKGGDLDVLPTLKAGYTLVVPALPKDPNDNRSQWVRQSSERSIYIFGQVKAPGRYAFNANLSFLDILSAAQGPNADADLRNVRITHRGENRVRNTHLNLSLYFETGDESLLPKVRPEDVIFVPQRNRAWVEKSKESTVRILGAVGRPGRYAYDDTMTILDLLAEAGGPLNSALQDKIVVVNRVKDGPEARTFDLVAFAKSGDFNQLPLLRKGDTVYVPNIEQSGWKIFSDGLSDMVSVLSLVRLVTGF